MGLKCVLCKYAIPNRNIIKNKLKTEGPPISLDRNVFSCNIQYMDSKLLDEKSFNELVSTLASCRDAALIGDFLKSLLTRSEVVEIANRWALVRLLDTGMSQRNIARELGLSLCNITRGSKELKKENSAFAAMLEEFKQHAGIAKKD